MRYDNPILASHLYDDYIMTTILYEDENITINDYTTETNGCIIPGIEIAIHSVEMSFTINDEPPIIKCEHCNQPPLNVDGIKVDPCMGGLLPGVRNACCGHGNPDNAYIQWDELDEDQSGAFYYPRYKNLHGMIAYSIIVHFSMQ